MDPQALRVRAEELRPPLRILALVSFQEVLERRLGVDRDLPVLREAHDHVRASLTRPLLLKEVALLNEAADLGDAAQGLLAPSTADANVALQGLGESLTLVPKLAGREVEMAELAEQCSHRVLPLPVEFLREETHLGQLVLEGLDGRVDRRLTLAELRVQHLLAVLELAVGEFEELPGSAGENLSGVLGEVGPQLFAELFYVGLGLLGGLQRGTEAGEFHLRLLVGISSLLKEQALLLEIGHELSFAPTEPNRHKQPADGGGRGRCAQDGRVSPDGHEDRRWKARLGTAGMTGDRSDCPGSIAEPPRLQLGEHYLRNALPQLAASFRIEPVFSCLPKDALQQLAEGSDPRDAHAATVVYRARPALICG